MWDILIYTNRALTANSQDIIVKDWGNSTSKLIDITILPDRNIALKETERKSNYKDLEMEMQKIWQVVPELVDAIGTIKTGIAENIKKVSESKSNRDPKDQHAAICKNPSEGAQWMNGMNDLNYWCPGCMVFIQLMSQQSLWHNNNNNNNNNNNHNNNNKTRQYCQIGPLETLL